ncbi:hypothetical protein IC63_00865 [Paracoccus sphaerophysae]|uniref:Uncharacterized protein n=1 Tax=Paracoccus sphaerophysae TaxID=690417 RepID=A0A099FI43_9RHOB|nr:hypothetical protein IC63_00865 [Paracoccus sphaerophysae]
MKSDTGLLSDIDLIEQCESEFESFFASSLLIDAKDGGCAFSGGLPRLEKTFQPKQWAAFRVCYNQTEFGKLSAAEAGLKIIEESTCARRLIERFDQGKLWHESFEESAVC